MKFNFDFSYKNIFLILLGLFYLFIIGNNILGNIEGMTDSEKIKKINNILNENNDSTDSSSGSKNSSESKSSSESDN